MASPEYLVAEAEGVKPLSHAQQKLIQSQQVQKERSFNTEVFIKELLMKHGDVASTILSLRRLITSGLNG